MIGFGLESIFLGLVGLFYLAVAIYVLVLATRFVKAVEKIANK